ncbi:MAG: hypothetical protein A3G59_02260 [Candidatus Taylorbacteria bacterium RIFCSPLOWO2_12_FULL_47_20]|uniref:Type II secretion system protein GspI C-terminal domain-containing protein n=2 Tax=Candidatus Tayloriibacteriota TaxID=1817919 RepID=A0A1G2P812_9BACT|nr:MAG: hypothetical protein A3H68_03665 [Candidatus Taylorbacteria bacterium RIFCSPLOWO2_02_FULL_46_40]OHA44505.1 MAG: hypothetical protein A3G59_02260 [Candidatus Taylorbacteria bacterium RIFCSPLOWO2_12_FULL_47_20]
MLIKYKEGQRGVSLVEVVVAAAILSLFGAAIAEFMSSLLRTSDDGAKIVNVSLSAEEGVEAVRLIRDRGWTQYVEPLVSGTKYYIYFGGGMAEATTTEITQGGLTRYFKVYPAYRDAGGDLASSGSVDSEVRRVSVTVEWQRRSAISTKTVETYISNLFND